MKNEFDKNLMMTPTCDLSSDLPLKNSKLIIKIGNSSKIKLRFFVLKFNYRSWLNFDVPTFGMCDQLSIVEFIILNWISNFQS